MPWKAEAIHGVLFGVPSAPQVDALEAWQIVTGTTTPDAFRRPSNSPASGSQAEGTFREYRLIVASTLGRLDLVVAQSQPEMPDAEPKQIENIEEASDILQQAMVAALSRVRVVRTALVCSLNEIYEDEQTLSARLSDLTGAWFPARARDSIYQINVPRAYIDAPQFEMNRVLTWSAGLLQVISGQIDIRGISQQFIQKVTPVVNWKIDLNSVTQTDVTDVSSSMISEKRSEVMRLLADGIGRVK